MLPCYLWGRPRSTNYCKVLKIHLSIYLPTDIAIQITLQYANKGNRETTRISAHWRAAYSLKQNWRSCLGLTRPCVPALITTYSTVTVFINGSLCSYTFISSVTPHCCHVSLFLFGSSTGSVCGLDCWGAQGGSALTVGGNSFRKYQTARHTHNPQSFFLFLLQAD